MPDKLFIMQYHWFGAWRAPLRSLYISFLFNASPPTRSAPVARPLLAKHETLALLCLRVAKHADPLLPNCKRQVRLPVRRLPRRCRPVERTP
jgi:hypothetical protein